MDRSNRADGARLNRPVPAIAALVLIAIIGISYRQWKQYNRANEAGVASRQISESVDALQSSLFEAEAGQRGFLLTGEVRYLEPYNQAVQRIPNELAALRGRLADRPNGSANLARLENLAGQKLADLRQTIDLRPSQGAVPAMAVVLSDRGKQTMDEIRSLSGEIKTAESKAQSEASLTAMAASQTALLVTIAGALVLLIFFSVGFEPFMTPQSARVERSWVVRYATAVFATVVAVLLRFAMAPLIAGSHSVVPFITFFPAVFLVAWVGGFRAAAFAILLSTFAAAYFFLAPEGSWRVANPGDLVTLFIFVVVSFGIAFTTESQRRAVERADQAENAERQQRQRFETTLASIGDAVIATDAKGRVTFANQVALSLVKWPESEAIGKNLDDVFRIVNEFTHKTVESPVVRVLREGNIVGLANHSLLLSRDGRETPIDDSAAPIKDAHGEMMGVVLIFRDITERRKAEEALRTSEERLATILKLLPIGVGVIDQDGHLVIGNPAWRKFLRGDIPGIHDEESARLRATTAEGQPLPRAEHPAMRALRGEEVVPGIDFLFKEGDGDERWMRVSAVPLRDASGHTTGALTWIQDVEEEKRAEQQRGELLARDRALAAEKALRELEVELARVVRALSVGELTTSIAHEINQPLAGVVTNAEAGLRWLSGEPPNIQEAKESLALIARDGNRASAVIRRIREFLRKEPPQHASLDLNEVVQGALDIARAELEKRGILLKFEPSSDLPAVLGDRIQLQQVVLNLAMNGADAMASVEGRRELLVASQVSADGFVEVAVRDTGVGVNPNDMPRMFDALFTTKPEGMGMGLFLSRSIIEAHHGRIRAEANHGPGVTVQFSLPVGNIGQPSAGERS